MASSWVGSSPAMAMRLRSSRQERPASTRMRVREEEMTVLLPLDPEANTVIRIIWLGYACSLWVSWGSNWFGSGYTCGVDKEQAGIGKPGHIPPRNPLCRTLRADPRQARTYVCSSLGGTLYGRMVGVSPKHKIKK